MQCKKFLLVFFLIVKSSFGYDLKNLDYAYDIGYKKLNGENLVIKDDLKKIHKLFQQDKTSNEAYMKYLNHVDKILEISDKPSYSTKTKFVLKDVYSQLKRELINLRFFKAKAIASSKIEPKKIVKKLMMAPKISVLDSKKIASSRKMGNVKESVFNSTSENILFASLAFLVLGLLGLIAQRRLRSKEEATQVALPAFKENPKNNGPRFKLTDYENVQVPIILIGDGDEVEWQNIASKGILDIQNGELFSINHLLQRDDEDRLIYEHSSNDYRVLIKKLRFNERRSRLISFIPVEPSYLSHFRAVEGGEPLGDTLEKALLSSRHLYAAAGIPVVIKNELNESIGVDQSEALVLSKMLKVVYQSAKDIHDTRVNIILSAPDESSLAIQFEIRNMNEVNSKLFDNGLESNIAESWSEVEMSLASRQARVFFIEDDNSSNSSFQIEMSRYKQSYSKPLTNDFVGEAGVF